MKINNSNTLFVGSFLSKVRGSMGVGESVASFLKEENIRVNLVSFKQNKFLRFFDIVKTILLFNGQKIFIDVFSGSSFLIAEISVILSCLREKKVVLVLHGGALPEYYSINRKRILKTFNRADLIITPSLYLKKFFSNEGFYIKHIPNSISLQNFQFNRSHVKPFTLLWVRAFASIYNPELPVLILERILRTYPQTTLTMIGPDIGSMSYVKKIATEKKIINNILFSGPIPNDQLYKFYQSHSVILNTTSYESFGLTLVEAASCGIPIISNNVGEISLIWEDKKDILLIRNNSLDEFESQIINVFKNDNLVDILTKNALINSKQYDWNNVKHAWIDLISKSRF